MRKLSSAILAIILCMVILPAWSEETDLSGYSYEELLTLRDAIDSRIEEIERENAVANADRCITFEQEEVRLYLGGTVNQRPAVERVKDSAPSRTEFTWSSSNPEIAQIKNTGTVTAVGEGTAVITAAAADNKYLGASYTVHVAVPVEAILLWGPDEPTIILGGDKEAVLKLGYSVEPEDATCQDVIWSSSDETVAGVDENGVVYGSAPGRAVITATSAEDPPAGPAAAHAEFKVTVRQLVTDIRLNETEIALNVGQTSQLVPLVFPENADNPLIHYASEDPGIASVDEQGVITAVAPGECMIHCSAADEGGTAADCRVVVSRLIEGIELPADSIRLPLGTMQQIDPVITPEDATSRELIWTSSNVLVARTANGMIEAVGQGECEISCAAADGSGLTASVHVRVPTFSTPEAEYCVTEKQGITIPVQIGKKGTQVLIQAETDCFTADWNEAGEIAIQPLNAGEGKIILSNPEDEKDTTEILVTVADSAVFNKVSYPPVPYDELAQNPEQYEGQQICLYGRVLQKSGDEDENTILMIGTSGEQYSDQVIQVRCGRELNEKAPEAESTATFYGLFRIEKIYSDALGSEIVFPGLEAEKIVPDETAEN